MTGTIGLPQGVGIESATNAGKGLLKETSISVNVGFTGKAIHLYGSSISYNNTGVVTGTGYTQVLFMGTTGGTTRKNVSSCMKITMYSDKYYPVFTAPYDGVYLFIAWGSVSNILAVNKQQLCSSSQQSGVKPLYLSKSSEAVFCIWFNEHANSGLSSGIDIVVMRIN